HRNTRQAAQRKNHAARWDAVGASKRYTEKTWPSWRQSPVAAISNIGIGSRRVGVDLDFVGQRGLSTQHGRSDLNLPTIGPSAGGGCNIHIGRAFKRLAARIKH